MNKYKKKQMDINANQKLRQNETNGDQCGSKIEAKTIETGIMCNATARKFHYYSGKGKIRL